MNQFTCTENVLSISHADLDGVVSQIVVGNVFPKCNYIISNFDSIDKKLSEVDLNKFDYVFVTDIHPMNPDLVANPKIILIDHHQSDLHNPEINNHIIMDDAKSASYLTYKYLSKYSSVDLSHLKKLVKYTNDYDTWQHKYPQSWELNELIYSKYSLPQMRTRFFHGDVQFTFEEEKHIMSRRESLQRMYDGLEIMEVCDGKMAVVKVNDYINDIADKLLKLHGYYVVVVASLKSLGRYSVRTSLDNFNVGQILMDLNVGGGRGKAAGMVIPDPMDAYEVIIKIDDILDDYVQKNMV